MLNIYWIRETILTGPYKNTVRGYATYSDPTRGTGFKPGDTFRGSDGYERVIEQVILCREGVHPQDVPAALRETRNEWKDPLGGRHELPVLL